jgi:competence protein ComEC
MQPVWYYLRRAVESFAARLRAPRTLVIRAERLGRPQREGTFVGDGSPSFSASPRQAEAPPQHDAGLRDRLDVGGASATPRISRARVLFQRAPLVVPAIGLITGIALDRSLSTPPSLGAAAFVIAGALFAIPRVRGGWGVVLLPGLAFAALGAVLHFDAMRRIPGDGIEQYLRDAPALARVRGIVPEPVRHVPPPPSEFARWSFAGEKTVFLLDLDEVLLDGTWTPIRGRIRVTCAEPLLDLAPEGRVEVHGWLYALRAPDNPGGFDWRTYLRRQGIVAGLRTEHRQCVQRLASASSSARLRTVLHRFRRYVGGLLTSDLASAAGEESTLLQTMLLGHRSQLDRRLNDVFLRAGCLHFLAVSGIHVVIVMSIARVCGTLLLLSRRGNILLMAAAVIVYVGVTEPRPSILRAAILALLYCCAALLGRRRTHLNWLSAGALILLLAAPASLFDIGFQLSFAGVLGVLYLPPALDRWVPMTRADLSAYVARLRGRPVTPSPAREQDALFDALRRRGLAQERAHVARRLLRPFVAAAAVSMAAWLVTLPIIALHFHRVQPWGWLNSAVVFPLVGIVMALGFAKVVATAVFAPLGAVVGVALSACDRVLIWVVDGMGSFPAADVFTPAPAWWTLPLYYGALAAILLCSRKKQNPLGEEDPGPEPISAGVPRVGANAQRTPSESDSATPARILAAAPSGSVRRSRVVLGAFAVILILVAFHQAPLRARDRLVVTALSVGAGTATVLELPDGRTLLYDVGSSRPYDVGRGVVLPYLARRGIRDVDRVYVSHPNLDHLNGIPSILPAVRTGPIVVNALFRAYARKSTPAHHFLELLRDVGHPVETLAAGAREWEEGGVRFDYLWPDPDAPAAATSSNDTSTVLRVHYAGWSVLLTGDIVEASLGHLATRGGITADVLMLPHHGSVHPSTGAFLEAVAARAAVQSSDVPGAESTHSWDELLGGVPLYNTADCGAVVITIDARRLRIDAVNAEPVEYHHP